MGAPREGGDPKVRPSLRPETPRAHWVRPFAARFDPINFVDKWSTPMLVIHGSKDYRLPETDGIGAFHALQQYVAPYRLCESLSDFVVP